MTSRSAPPPDLRSRRRVGVASITAVIATLFTAPTHAEDAVELEWSAPPGCPDASVVMARIRSLAGGTLRTKERLRATGRIERRGERFRLTLTVRDEGSVGERTVDSDSCADLAGAAAVALGLLLENKRHAEEAQTRPDEKPGAGQKSATGSGDATAASDPEKTRKPPKTAPDDGADSPPESEGGERAFRVLAQLPLATLDFGPLPATSFGLGVGLGVQVEAFRAVAVGRYFTTVNVVAPDYAEAGVDVDRLSAELWTGYGWRAGRFELTPCVTGALDHYTARGVGRYVAPRSARILALALGVGVMADLHVVDWLSITGTAAVRAETSRPRLVIDDFGEVRRLGPAQASLALGLTGVL
jgi:hypothetical protein